MRLLLIFHVDSVIFQFHLVPHLGLVLVKLGKDGGFFIIKCRSANSVSTIKLAKLMKAKRDEWNNHSL